MKNLLITTAVLATFAVPAMAADLGNGFILDTTISTEYSVENDKLSAFYEGQLNYAFGNGFNAYAYTEVDLRDPEFVGLDLGVEYNRAELQALTLTAEVQLDDKLEYSDLVLKAELEF